MHNNNLAVQIWEWVYHPASTQELHNQVCQKAADLLCCDFHQQLQARNQRPNAQSKISRKPPSEF
jgi:uncharacterized tellurite resistance protein B-like protein